MGGPIASKTTDNALKGSVSLNIVVDTGMENGVQNPNFLKRLDAISEDLKKYLLYRTHLSFFLKYKADMRTILLKLKKG